MPSFEVQESTQYLSHGALRPAMDTTARPPIPEQTLTGKEVAFFRGPWKADPLVYLNPALHS